MTLKELLEKKAEHVKAAADLRDKAKAESRDISEAELTAIEKHIADAEAVDADIKSANELNARADAVSAKINTFSASAGRVTTPNAITPPVASVRELVNDDPKRGFRSMGDFGMAVLGAHTPGVHSADNRLRILASATGNNVATGADGGFLVPPQFATTIWDGMNSLSDNLLARTDQYTVQGESLEFPANAETSRATGSRYGGVQGYWIAEAAQITSSRPKFRKVRVEPQDLAVLVYVTEKLLKTSPVALDHYISRAAADEINFLVGDAIINGTGVGQPKGILNSACVVSVAKETSQVAATLVQENISKMWGRMHPRSRANAVWFMNVDVEPQLDSLNTKIKNVAGSENVGGITQLVYNAEKQTLKGRPIVFIEYCQTLGTVGDVILADMSGYLTGVRGGIESAMSMHLRFDYAEQAFRFMFAADGQTWLASAITPAKGSNTLSQFVTLATRG